MSDTGAALELASVAKSYGLGRGHRVSAADDVTLSIPAGSLVALTGASGSGKSTLLHLIGALDSVAAGTIVNNGVDITKLRGRALADYRRTIGFVFQRYNLLPTLTALDNVIAPVLPYRTSFNKKARGLELLTAVGLADRTTSLPSQLSGGEQQRVAIARALMASPSLLLADEPTGSLDSSTATQILDLLGELHRSRGMTMILATHDPQVAARCQRMVRLRDGRIVDDVDLTDGYQPADVVRRIGQLG